MPDTSTCSTQWDIPLPPPPALEPAPVQLQLQLQPYHKPDPHHQAQASCPPDQYHQLNEDWKQHDAMPSSTCSSAWSSPHSEIIQSRTESPARRGGRRRHTKSRTGCSTCKRRRIRCDEKHPQCGNCTKHNVRCPFHDTSVQTKSLLQATCQAGRPWLPKIKAEVKQWRTTGSIPIPGGSIRIPIRLETYSEEDLCFLHQVAKVQYLLTEKGVSKLTVISSYLPSFFRITSTSRLAMNGFLAISAYQVASITHCQHARRKRYHYQMLAFQDLRECVSKFVPEHANEALVASVALLWLCEDMSGWRYISEGISAIIQNCKKHEFQSEIYCMIAKAWLPASPCHSTPKPDWGRSRCLQQAIDGMKEFEAFLKEQELNGDTLRQLKLLIDLAEDLAKMDLSTPPEKQFEQIRLLRDGNMWLRLNGALTGNDLSSTLMVNAYSYTIALYTERQIPQVNDLRVDLRSLLHDTLRQVTDMKYCTGLVDNLKTLASII